MFKKIKELSLFINNIINKLDKEHSAYARKIKFKDLLLQKVIALSEQIGTYQSTGIYNWEINNKITAQAFNTFFLKIESKVFRGICDAILKQFFDYL